MKPALVCVGIAIVCALSLAACQPQSAGGSGANEGEANTVEPLKITEIRVGKHSGESTAAIEPLAATDTIRVAVKTTGTSKGAQLEAKLFNLSNGQAVGAQTQQIVAKAHATIQLVFKPETAWRPGRYLVEVKLDGKLVGQRDIDIGGSPSSAQAK